MALETLSCTDLAETNHMAETVLTGEQSGPETARERDKRIKIVGEKIDSDELWGELSYAKPTEYEMFGMEAVAGGCIYAVPAPISVEFIDICIFSEDPKSDPNKAISRVRLSNRSEEGVLYGFIPGLKVGQKYGLRVCGEWNPSARQYSNYTNLVLDPYSRAITGDPKPENKAACLIFDDGGNIVGRDFTDSAPFAQRSVVIDKNTRVESEKPRIPMADTIVYEAHIKGLTMLHPDVPENLRGTYAGMVYLIKYLKDLGITTVEIMPPQHFVAEEDYLRERGLVNYWGYNTLGFFAPHAGYSSSGQNGEQVKEFQEMVAAYHAAGLEIVIDVVYNHTAEGSERGPDLMFKSLDPESYYQFEDGIKHKHKNEPGCGNTFNTYTPEGLTLVLASMRYWSVEMGVDGFRLDLATILSPAFIRAVENDPVLREVKLIPEPWDPAGRHALGDYSGRWSPWHDKFRDGVRNWTMGYGSASEISRLLVSREVYLGKPFRGLPLNFVTAHDGFTMADLVSYIQKHNLANGNDNTDGDSNNHSRNHGVEGPTDDESIINARYQDMRNLMLTLMVSGGVPMIRGGDELSATQGGNNNAYCQDNETTWLNHDLSEPKKREFFEFVKKAIDFRRKRLLPLGINTKPNIQWLQGDDENFKDESWPHHRVVGMALTSFAIADAMGQEIEDDKVIFYTNGSRQDHRIKLPRGRFEVLFDTASGAAAGEGEGEIVKSGSFVLKALSSVIVGIRRLPEDASKSDEKIIIAA